jgi:hypothetical protein
MDTVEVRPRKLIHAASDQDRQAPKVLVTPLAAGLLAALGLLGLYLGLITWAQGWAHALQQLTDDRWFVAALAVGLGAQGGLFIYLRDLQAHAAMGGLAASTGTGTTAMAACCAYHLADVLPILGLSGAAIVLNARRSPLLWLGVVMNLAGVAYLLLRISQQRRSRTRLAATHEVGQQRIRKELTMHQLSLKVVTATTTVFAALVYAVCLGVHCGLLVAGQAAYTTPLLQATFPGFSWTAGGILLGLLEITLAAAIGSVVFVGLYNFFVRRLTPAPV